MEEILQSLGLSQHLAVFMENKIGLEETLHLTDEEFHLLGVHLIGDRVRIRNRCTETLNGRRSSVLATFMERRKRRKTGNAKCLATRKVELGWKHHSKGRFQLMSERRGGGKHSFDAPKDITRDGLLVYSKNLFFPSGTSFDGIKLNDVRSTLCYFNAQRVSEKWRDNETLSDYVQRVNTNPIRFYLHTEPIECTDTPIPRRPRTRSTRILTVASTQTLSEFRGTVEEVTGTDLIVQDETNDLSSAHANSSHGTVEEVTDTDLVVQDETNDLSSALAYSSPGTVEEVTDTDLVVQDETNDLSSAVAYSSPGTVEEVTGTDLIVQDETNDLSSAHANSNHVQGPLEEVTLTNHIVEDGTNDLSSAHANDGPCMDNDIPSYSGTPTIIFHRPDMYDLLDTESDDDDKLPVPQLTSTQTSLTLSEIIEVWRNEVMLDGTQPILIQRNKVLQTVRRAVNKPAFDFRRPVYIEFSNEDVGIEDGADDGGPRREFFTELMKDLKVQLLEGERGSFRHDVGALEAGRYREAGKMVAWSILNGGPGFPFLSGSTYGFLVGREVGDIRLEDVPDMHVRDMLHKILNSDTTDDLRIACQDEETTNWMLDSGIMKPISSIGLGDKEDLVRQLFKSHMFYRIHAEIQDFRKGLQELEILKYITGSPEATESLFVDTAGPINYRQLKSMYTVNLSPLGSNSRSEEDDTMFAWEDFLRTCESGDSTVTLADVLRFWTGSERVPPLGFDHKMSITFVPKRTPAPLPVAHTCGLVLELMRGFDADMFADKMSYAVNHSGGFFIA